MILKKPIHIDRSVIINMHLLPLLLWQRKPKADIRIRTIFCNFDIGSTKPY